MRGVGQSTYTAAAAKEIFTAVTERSNPDLHLSMIFELIPRQKINSVPKDACAFYTRGPAHSVVGVTNWDKTSDEKAAKAKENIGVLTQIIANHEKDPKDASDSAYSNYSTFASFVQ